MKAAILKTFGSPLTVETMPDPILFGISSPAPASAQTPAKVAEGLCCKKSGRW